MINKKENNDKDSLISSLLVKYNTARIDIKNSGNKNSIELLSNSDDEANVIFPRWSNDEKGIGITLESHQNSIDLKIKCNNDGVLSVNILGLEIRNAKNERIPLYIEYSSLKINNKEYLEENKIVWHNQPYKINKKVKDCELIHIHTEWLPLNDSVIYKAIV